MSGIVLAVGLSLLSAVGYALAAVTQSRLASLPRSGRGGLRALLGRPLWWWAVGLNAAGALTHVVALHHGPLTLVQPLGALTLVTALPLAARYERRRVTRGQWRGALATLAGLAGLIAVTGPAAPVDALSVRQGLVVGAVSALLVAVLAGGAAGGRVRAGGLRYAGASGIASGVASALTQTLTAALSAGLPGGAPPWWQTALVAVLVSGFAAGGLLLSQAAYRGGLGAPLAVANLVNPAAAAVVGMTLLGETFRAGVWGWPAAALAAAVAARGVVLLTGGTREGAPANVPPAASPTDAAPPPDAVPPPPRAGRARRPGSRTRQRPARCSAAAPRCGHGWRSRRRDRGDVRPPVPPVSAATSSSPD